MRSEFERDTAVTATAPNEYPATVTDRWNALGNRPNGGYVLAIALRALGADLPLPDPISVTAYFLRPATVGPVTIRTALTRAGRRVATGKATQSSEFWMRLSDGHDADPVALAALVDAAPPATTDLGILGSATLELTVHIRARPAPGWLACRVATRHVINGLADEDFEIWDLTGQLVAQSRQLALLP